LLRSALRNWISASCLASGLSFEGSLFHRWSIFQCLKPLQVGLVPTSLLTHIGDVPACLGKELAGIGASDEFGRELRKPPLRIITFRRRQPF